MWKTALLSSFIWKDQQAKKLRAAFTWEKSSMCFQVFIDIGQEKNAFLYVDDAVLPPEIQKNEVPRIRKNRKRTINELVKPGQNILVQVVKEAIGTKGARVTRHVTFPGRYLVLMPTVNYVGVSRRITEDEERQRLRKLAKDVKPRNMGVIIRTVAEKKSREEIEGICFSFCACGKGYRQK